MRHFLILLALCLGALLAAPVSGMAHDNTGPGLCRHCVDHGNEGGAMEAHGAAQAAPCTHGAFCAAVALMMRHDGPLPARQVRQAFPVIADMPVTDRAPAFELPPPRPT